jgi:phosphatidate phosphatase APP1
VALSRFGAAIDEGINRQIVGFLAPRGWRPRIIGLTGYGSRRSLHVMARVVLAHPRPRSDPEDRRGWHSFMTAQVGDLPVVVRAGVQTVRTTSSAGGYIDVMVPDHGLGPGWHEVTIEAKAAAPARATVLVVDPAARIGLVSDIDDTVMVTMLPRALIAAWNTFVRHTSARRPVPGMAELYRQIVDEHPHAPVFYLSTGAWNVAPTLRRFLAQHGLPNGPMLLTDWGPTNTGWFRSGIEHKRTRLRDLMITYPDIRWVLVGDDGQHDPMIYDDVARMHPRKVAAIAIRTLSPAEQVLSHGTPETLGRPSAQRNVTAEHGVPTVQGRDGYALARSLPSLIPAG